MHPDALVMAFDVRHAYKSILRGPCLEANRFLRPELAALVENLSSRSSRYWYYQDARGHACDIHVDGGLKHRDGFARVLFADGLRQALADAVRRF